MWGGGGGHTYSHTDSHAYSLLSTPMDIISIAATHTATATATATATELFLGGTAHISHAMVDNAKVNDPIHSRTKSVKCKPQRGKINV